MNLSKRILRAINEGITNALMLDDTDNQTINRKSSTLISNDIVLSTKKTLLIRKLQEALNDEDKAKIFITLIYNLYLLDGIPFNPLLDGENFKKFIDICISVQGNYAFYIFRI